MKKLRLIFVTFILLIVIISIIYIPPRAIQLYRRIITSFPDIGTVLLPLSPSPYDIYSYNDTPILYGPYKVIRIIDGDTIVVSINDTDAKIRLIGIDTPESTAPQYYTDKTGKLNSEEGITASDYVTQLLSYSSVYLEYDVQMQDYYGRTLAYVYLSDGNTMVNRLLLQNGYAQVMTIQPNSKYADEFAQLQHTAESGGVGFWGIQNENEYSES